MSASSNISLIFRRHFSPLHFYIDRRNKLALVINPKVASTFSRNLLTQALKEFGGFEDPSEGRYPGFTRARTMPIASISDYFHFLRNTHEYRVLCFVRNPYARILSAWKDKFLDSHQASEDGSQAAYPRSMRKGELAKARHFAQTRGMDGALDNSLYPFETFVEYVASQAEGARNQHWDTQKAVLFLDAISYWRCYQIEEGIVPALEKLLSAWSVPEDWLEQQAARPANPSSSQGLLLNKQLADRIYDIYMQDFDAFGYAYESWRNY